MELQSAILKNWYWPGEEGTKVGGAWVHSVQCLLYVQCSTLGIQVFIQLNVKSLGRLGEPLFRSDGLVSLMLESVDLSGQTHTPSDGLHVGGVNREAGQFLVCVRSTNLVFKSWGLTICRFSTQLVK